MAENNSYNRLNTEQSRFLLQHAEDPIHWWSFGPDAIQFAQDNKKPIFLSIGFSSCHWCHQMHEESFKDQQIADLLNENFICIKVDREEFPDIDQYYQKAAGVFGKHGGWPLNAFLLSDMSPFFVGSYFPKVGQEGLPSFTEVIRELSRAYSNDHETVLKNATEARGVIETKQSVQQKIEFEGHYPTPAAILEAIKSFADEENGGYGDIPKFPNLPFWEWTVEQMAENMIPRDLGDHVIKSLDKMIMGGIFDQTKGGLHRYSSDKKWLRPHFEKMLYDQAALLKTLTKLTLIYPSPLHFDAILQTLNYLETEMLGEKNFFYSSQDADSEGHEGLYFSYTMEEFEEAIKASHNDKLVENLEQLKKWFNITAEGNFTNSLNIPNLSYEDMQIMFEQQNWELVRETRQALMEERKNRIPPTTDTKGIAGHNFMLITALCDLIQYTRIDVIRNQASKILNIILKSVHDSFILPNNEGDHSSIRHTTTLNSTLPYFEDYVFFAECQLRVYEVTGNAVFKTNAIDSVNYILKDFFKNGRFYVRSTVFDDSRPYANLEATINDDSHKSPVATFINLVRRITILENDHSYLEKIKEMVEFATQLSLHHPIAHGEALRALCYPADIYRKVLVPKKWLQDNKFINLLPHFPSRFVLDFHEEENQSWQFWSLKGEELKGQEFEEFSAVFMPKEQQAQPAAESQEQKPD